MTVSAIHQLPSGFLWGCATAAHQVEGGNINDWWRWEQEKGHIYQDQQAGQACEWWSGRYAEDFDRAAQMHNNAHRLSVEWSRIEPSPGQFDLAALDRYRMMLRALRERGLTPMVTLHHFTNPLWLMDKGGWAWDETPKRFATFAAKVVEALKDECTLWCTINEPMVFVMTSYFFGERPPGGKNPLVAFTVIANLLRAHAAAYHAIKAEQPQAQVGFASNHIGIKPEIPAWVHAPLAAFVDSVYNDTFINAFRDGVVRFPVGSVRIPNLQGTLDWVGLQYYFDYAVAWKPTNPLGLFIDLRKPRDLIPGPPTWGGLNPAGIFPQIKRLYKKTRVPIYITEVGVPDGEDAIRPQFMVETIRAVWTAVNFNYPIKGLFWWSLIDNFEWLMGYDPQYNFGLYQVDFATQQRTPRTSAQIYSEICEANGLSSATVERYTPDLLPTLFPGEAGLLDVKLDVKLKPRMPRP